MAESLISNDFTHTWALAKYLATEDHGGENPNDRHMENEEQQLQAEDQNALNPDDTILSVKEQIHKIE